MARQRSRLLTAAACTLSLATAAATLSPAAASGAARAASPQAAAPLTVKHALHISARPGTKAATAGTATTTNKASLVHPAAAGEAWSLENGQIDVDIASDGRFTLGSEGASGYELMFGWPGNPWSSFTTARVDGADYPLPQADTADNPAAAAPDVPATGDYDQRSWLTGGVLVTQTLTLVANPATGNYDALHMVWRMTSADGGYHTGSLRTLIDDDVHGSDGAVFHVPGYGEPHFETEFAGTSVPDRLTLYPSDSDSVHAASALLSSAGDTRPDRLVIAHWPDAHGTTYDYTPDPANPLGSDSAYLAYWTDRGVPAAGSTAVSTTYGVGHLISDTRPPLDVTVDAPPTFTAVPAISTAAAYSPDQLVVGVSLTNTSNTDVDRGVHVDLLLPPGLSSASPSQPVGDLAPGGQGYTSFPMHADGAPTAHDLDYTVRVYDANGFKDIPAHVHVPAAALLPVRYAALGDSFSAGEGTQSTGWYDSNSSKCNRTLGAYSGQLTRPGDIQPLSSEAKAGFSGTAYNFFACTGAVVNNLEQDGYHSERAQLAEMREVNPNLVTLTIGGNDIGFVPLLEECLAVTGGSGLGGQYAGATQDCTQVSVNFVVGHKTFSSGLVESTNQLVAAQESRIRTLLSDIKGDAAPDATVLIAGYPQIFTTHLQPGCLQGAVIHAFLDTNEINFFRSTTQKLDDVIARAARSVPGTAYVDPLPQFDGHQICAGDQDYFVGLAHKIGGGSAISNTVHPTPEGQQAYARAFNTWLTDHADGARNSGGIPVPTSIASIGPRTASPARADATAAAAPARPAAPADGAAPGPRQVAAATKHVALAVQQATLTVLGGTNSTACSTNAVSRGTALSVDADGFAPGKAVRVDILDTGKTASNLIPGLRADRSGHVHTRVTVPASAAYTAAAAVNVIGMAPGGASLVAAFGSFSVVKSAACKTAGKAATATLALVGASVSAAVVKVDGKRYTLRPGADRVLTLPAGTHTVSLLGRKRGHLITLTHRKVTLTTGVPVLLAVTGTGTGTKLSPLSVPTPGLRDTQALVQTFTAAGASALTVSVSAPRRESVVVTAGKRATVRIWRAGKLVQTVAVTLRARQQLVIISVGTGASARVLTLRLPGQALLS
jgi:lysophospholipase L1-like esterase